MKYPLLGKWLLTGSKHSVNPNDAANYLMGIFKDKVQEHFYCLCLDTKNQIIHERTIFMGSLNASIVHLREIFHTAIKHSADAVIVAHNHPSGDPAPSREDVQVTERLVKAGEHIGIEVLDHIVIGDETYYSLKEKGLI
ncbi:DNA repair protein RadC [Caldalkalibacillus uzonensis]|uniref:DNA repair protein RadC n=1 Tax=Caldalkalibacillus uzonensis TaxID=353224 RepID=A0ABU0CY21_9BACI|nr:DNA repair protein RadC [Caldalkalibacillus uzonensis]MDQ0341038.1 DNA repair protein RadC [Caldalkalibacillus uzonensis]